MNGQSWWTHHYGLPMWLAFVLAIAMVAGWYAFAMTAA